MASPSLLLLLLPLLAQQLPAASAMPAHGRSSRARREALIARVPADNSSEVPCCPPYGPQPPPPFPAKYETHWFEQRRDHFNYFAPTDPLTNVTQTFQQRVLLRRALGRRGGQGADHLRHVRRGRPRPLLLGRVRLGCESTAPAPGPPGPIRSTANGP